MANPEIHSYFTEHYLQAEKAQHGPLVNVISAGVCALIVDHDDRVFYARHTEKEGRYPNESVGTSSETFRWVPMRKTLDGRVTESPYEAWIRSLQEELGMPDSTFNKAGFSFEWSNPTTNANIIDISRKPAAPESLWAINLFVRVDNPEAVMHETQTSEEILSTGFAPIEEVLELEPFRPGFLAWYQEAFRQFKLLPEDLDHSEPVPWTDPNLLPPVRVDVKLT